MTTISSQEYLNWEIVEEKMGQLKESEAKEIELKRWYIGEIDGEEYAILADGHHTLAASRELGLPYYFVTEADPEGLTGTAALEARYIDSDWYDVEKSNPAEYKFERVW